MRVKLLSIFGTRFTYIIQKFLQLPSLLRQLSVIIYSERSGRDSAARNRRRRRRETRARGERRRRRRRRDKRASRNSSTVASSALLGATRFPLALNLGRESAGSKAHLRGDSRANSSSSLCGSHLHDPSRTAMSAVHATRGPRRGWSRSERRAGSSSGNSLLSERMRRKTRRAGRESEKDKAASL